MLKYYPSLSHVRIYIKKKNVTLVESPLLCPSFPSRILLFLSSHLSVYRSRLPLLVREFLPLAFRYPVFIHASFFLLFFLFLARHIPRHGSFHLLSSSRLRSVFPPFISLRPHHSHLPRPHPRFSSRPPPKTYFLETSEFTCSKSLRFDRSVVSQLVKSGFALCIHLRFAKSRSLLCTHRSTMIIRVALDTPRTRNI